MNLAFFSRFSKTRKTNGTFRIVDHIRKHPVFKKSRVDLYTSDFHPEKLVVLLGQMHTVWKGKIGNRERKKIVKCQARLCSYYAYFEQFHNINKFGGEGLYDGLEISYRDTASFDLYRQLEKKLSIQRPVRLEQLAKVASRILAELGKDWHNELRLQRNLKRIQVYAAAVSGQTLFNFLNEGRIRVFPVEGERAYQHVLEKINHLGDRIAKLEQSYELKVVRQRGGKVKTEKESEVIKQYNALVKEFNRIIGSDLRERATMDILKEKSELEKVVVFTMGVGHRKNYLKLADQFFRGKKTAFVFITPPELLINWWIAIGMPFVLLLILFILDWIFFGIA